MTEKVQGTNGTQVDTNQLLAMLTSQVVSLTNQVNQLMENGGVRKNGRGGRHAPQHVLDTKTNKVYRTKAEAGIAVAPEYGLKVHNFVWYELVKGSKKNPAKCPDRFKVIDEDTYQKLLDKQGTKTPQVQGQKK